MERQEVGYLSICFGCMFSGKTSWLLQQYKKYSYIGKKICVINYADDKRYDDKMLSTHDKQMIPCIQTYSLESVRLILEQNHVILINEGQFFKDLYKFVDYIVNILNKKVYVCGLDGDFQRKKIGSILDIIPLCDDVIKIKAICSNCKINEGMFTYRLSDEKEQVVVGSSNYSAVCRKCYNSFNNLFPKN